MSEARAIRRDGSAALDLAYVAAGRFDGFLKAKHNRWTQTFRVDELHNALDSCAMAILGHELVPKPQSHDAKDARVPHHIIAPPEFPESVEE